MVMSAAAVVVAWELTGISVISCDRSAVVTHAAAAGLIRGGVWAGVAALACVVFNDGGAALAGSVGTTVAADNDVVAGAAFTVVLKAAVLPSGEQAATARSSTVSTGR